MVTRIRPSTMTKLPVPRIGSQFASRAGDREREEERPTSDLGRLLVSFGLFRRCVVRRDRERTEADRKGLAERDDPADDRQSQRPVAGHQRVDLARDLGDLAVGRADGDRPVARSTHHHALEDGLAADCLSHR